MISNETAQRPTDAQIPRFEQEIFPRLAKRLPGFSADNRDGER